MRFGRIAIGEVAGAILAHSVRGPGFALKKGEVIQPAHIATLAEAGIEAVVAATLETGDVPENVAAHTLAERIAGAGVRLERPFTGRCNLIADAAGLLVVDAVAIDSINAIDESITVATLTPMRPVVAGEMIATVKIIPFAVPGKCLAASVAAVTSAPVSVAPFRPLQIGVISTMLPGLKPVTVEKTLRLLDERLALAASKITREACVAHDALQLADLLRQVADIDVLVVFGASAITDRRDVVPAAIEAAGGTVEHLGMPVDPGNLLLLGRLGHDDTAIPVIGAPGCARSPKENGFDFVLWRLLAGLPVTGTDLRRMGVGGLLSEIVTRPQPRQSDEDG